MKPERTGLRNLDIRNWHRRLGGWITAVDVDLAEYCYFCKRVLALLEIVRVKDVRHPPRKATTIMRKLANGVSARGYLVAYRSEGEEVLEVGLRRVVPTWGAWRVMSASEFGEWLTTLHLSCPCLREE